ncbi:hypothetical protein bcgnr5380_23440 [Bacillus cereus]
MLPFSYCNSRFNLLKRVFTLYIELLKVIKRYEMRNQNGNCHSKNERDTSRRENKEVDEAFAVALKYIYKEYSESMLGVSD